MGDSGSLLASLRVLDLSAGEGDAVSRILADLGAEVLKVEPPGGSPARTALPRLGGTSVAFALHNANKRSAVLDPAVEGDRRRLLDLAGAADIVIDSGIPGRASAYGTSCADLADRYGHLVVLSVTDFGTTGPRSTWRVTDAVLYALSSALSRSGPPVGTPVLPPDGIASATAAVQATWAVLVAHYNRLRCGRGDYIDFSRFEAVVLALDPPFGSHGQAAAAQGVEKWRGRPRNQDAYPIIPCKDGHVRLVVMAPRQWRGLRAWLGEPAAYQDAKFDSIAERFAVWGEVGTLLAAQFADAHHGRTRGRRAGARGADRRGARAVGGDARRPLPGGRRDGRRRTGPGCAHQRAGRLLPGRRQRAGFRTPAPAVGIDEPRWHGPAHPHRPGSG